MSANSSRGEFSEFSNQTSCTNAGVGFYVPLLASNLPIAAETGSFVGTPGQTASTPCPVGTFNSVRGASACLRCADNSFTARSGSIVCDTCIWPKVVTPDFDSCQRITCALGFQPSQIKAGHCIPCPSGSFRGDNNTDVCVSCSGNSHAFRQGMTVCYTHLYIHTCIHI